jgi:hypothetical protein
MTGTGNEGQGTEFDGLVNLFKDELTACQYDRQISILMKLLKRFPNGFYVRSGLNGIPETIRACIQRINEGRMEFVGPFQQLLELAGQPFVYYKAQDSLHHKQCTLNILNATAEAMSVHHEKVRLRAVTTLYETVARVRAKDQDDLTLLRKHNEAGGSKPAETLGMQGSLGGSGAKSGGSSWHYGHQGSIRPDESLKYDKRSTLHEAVRESTVVTRLVNELKQSSSQSHDMLTAIVKGLRECSYYAHCCRLITNQGGLDQLFSLLEECDFRDYAVFIALETVWNVLELNPTAKELVGSFHYVSVLHQVLRSALINGYKLKEKEFRNDCIAVCTLVAEDPDNHPYFFKTGLTELVFIVGAGTEIGLEHEALKPFMQTIADEDFELKKLAWNLLYILSFHSDNAFFLRESDMLKALFQYLDVDCSTPEVVRWPTLQLLDLQYVAINIITQLSLNGARHFAEANGANIMLTFLRECMDLNLRNTTLRSLVHLANSENQAAFVEANAIECMLQLITVEIDLNVKRDCFQVISDLCAGTGPDQELARQQFGELRGVELLVPYLDLDPNNQTSQNLLYVIVDCVWNAIVGMPTNEQRFLELKGVHKMLDALEKSPNWIQLCLLTCLVDAFQSPKVVAQARAWSHKIAHTPVEKLLISLWKDAGSGPQEPEKAKVIADSQAQDEDIDTTSISFSLKPPPYRKPAPVTPVSPLLPKEDDEADPPTGVVDLLARVVNCTDLKTKIYCLFSHIGLDGHDILTFEEQKLLSEIRQHVDMRKDRMWEYVEVSLRDERCRPTSPDREKLEGAAEARTQRRDKLKHEQDTWREKEYAWLDKTERTFYSTLIKKSDDEEALKKRKHTGLTITQAKIRKSEMLKASFQSAQSKQKEAVWKQTQAYKDLPQPDPQTLDAERMGRRSPASAPIRHSPSLDSALSPSPPSAPSGDQYLTVTPPLELDALDQFAILEGADSDIPPSVRAFADRTPAQLGGTEGQQFLSEVEYGIFNGLKTLRKEPESFIPTLTVLKRKAVSEAEADGKDPTAVREAFDRAIKELNKMTSQKAIKIVPIGMTLAARDLALTLGLKGLLSAEDLNSGLSAASRMGRYGTCERGEPCDLYCFGRRSPDDIVCQLMVQAAEAGQMHQLFNPDYRALGVGVGWHRLYQYVCVVTLGGSFRDKPRPLQQTVHERFIQVMIGNKDKDVVIAA